MANMLQQVEAEQIASLKKQIPDFSAGDTVIVQVRVKEGNRERLQAFEGVVIAKRNRGLNSAFTVRKISHGEGVERVFQTYSPLVDNIKVKRRGDVRQAKLYYLRELAGRAARIKERLTGRKAKEIAPLADTIVKPEPAAETKTEEPAKEAKADKADAKAKKPAKEAKADKADAKAEKPAKEAKADKAAKKSDKKDEDK